VKSPGTHPELAMQPGVRPRLGDRMTKIMARFLPFKSARKPALQIFLEPALPRASQACHPDRLPNALIVHGFPAGLPEPQMNAAFRDRSSALVQCGVRFQPPTRHRAARQTVAASRPFRCGRSGRKPVKGLPVDPLPTPVPLPRRQLHTPAFRV
jgi:hypothetical protein